MYLLLPIWVLIPSVIFSIWVISKPLTYFTTRVEYRPICLEIVQVFLWKPKPSASPSLQLRLSGSGLFRLNRKRIKYLCSSLYPSVYRQSALRQRRALFYFVAVGATRQCWSMYLAPAGRVAPTNHKRNCLCLKF